MLLPLVESGQYTSLDFTINAGNADVISPTVPRRIASTTGNLTKPASTTSAQPSTLTAGVKPNNPESHKTSLSKKHGQLQAR